MRMSMPTLAFAIFMGLTAGFFLRGAFQTGPSPDTRTDYAGESLADTVRRLRSELAALEEERRNDRNRIAELTRLLAEAQARSAVVSTTTGPGSAPLPRRENLPYRLGSPDEANALYEEALERMDLEALWKLGAVLLSMGEPGYQKLIELMSHFTEELKNDRTARLWMNGEMLAGRFFRDFAEHHDNFMRFSLYLYDKDPETLPEPMREFREELRDDIGTLLLGFHGGEDPVIEEGFLRMYSEVLSEDAGAGRHDIRKAVRGLAQLRSDAATDLLLNFLPRAKAENVPEVVMALGYQGNKRAVPTLEALRNEVTDKRTTEAIDAVLKRLR